MKHKYFGLSVTRCWITDTTHTHMIKFIMLFSQIIIGVNLIMSSKQANKQTKDEEYIPMNSPVAFGARTPTFGRTEYFLGEVVLT